MTVIFTLDEFEDSRRDFETFFFSHITLIEGQLVSLRSAIESSACEPKATEYIMEVRVRAPGTHLGGDLRLSGFFG